MVVMQEYGIIIMAIISIIGLVRVMVMHQRYSGSQMNFYLIRGPVFPLPEPGGTITILFRSIITSRMLMITDIHYLSCTVRQLLQETITLRR